MSFANLNIEARTSAKRGHIHPYEGDMKLRLLYMAVLYLIAWNAAPAPGQSANNTHTLLKVAAEKYVQAYMRQDYATCMNMMGGAVVEGLGGKITVLDHFRRTEEALHQHQLKLETMTVDEPRAAVARGPKTQLAVIPEKHIFTGPEGKYILNSYLLAISENSGQSWNMLEGSWRVSEYIKTTDLVLYDLLKLPVRKIYLADDPKLFMLEKGDAFVMSPETIKYKKKLRKSNL